MDEITPADTARDGAKTEDADPELTLQRLEALHQGVACFLMPVEDGWRVHYFSMPSFEDQPGTDFGRFDEAIEAICDVLEVVNTPEQREQAGQELRVELRKYARNRARGNQSP